ncbi:TauD/TfdA dioxygenase family protein [Siccirubricoccus deserti]
MSLSALSGPRYKAITEAGLPYETITVEKLTPIIGAEIGGVALGGPVSNRQMDEIHRALAENLVIFFRDQHMTQEQHLEFGRQFGPLHLHPAAPHEPGHPELMIIKADEKSVRANGEGWHSDVSCDVEPPLGSILYIKECPPHGGDTLFASMYAAYEALSDRMKAYLDGLRAVHDGEPVYRGMFANDGVADKPSYPRAEHPVIRTHPVTGRRALYVNRGFTTRILGIPPDESEEFSATSTSTWRTRCSSAASAGSRFRGLLGQPLRPAPGDVGLLAAPPLRQSGNGEGRTAGLIARGVQVVSAPC